MHRLPKGFGTGINRGFWNPLDFYKILDLYLDKNYFSDFLSAIGELCFVFVFLFGVFIFWINENGAPTSVGCEIADADIERSAGVRFPAGGQKLVDPIHGCNSGKSLGQTKKIQVCEIKKKCT